ncbi:zinc finger protein 862-like [Saccostrea cucullata]|uniref:zinc finger protein 862-like n=1 Tax=Saccostrea cuccullata TaxID=36930 RepID=UPI002ED3DD4F
MLDKAKGLQIGNTYLTDKYCQQFVSYIADVHRDLQKEKVEHASFLSIISDGSTDTSSKETEIVYIKASVNCEVFTYFAGLKHVSKADAEGISRAISGLLDTRFGPLWRSKVVAMSTDGASVMVGKKGGVVKMISYMTNRPFLKGIHCSAHRFELAYKDGIKDIPIHKKCELLLLNLYLFYKYSSLSRANLKIAFDSIGKNVGPNPCRWNKVVTPY